MSPGKAIAQAGHAYLQSFLTSCSARDPAAPAYGALCPGTKIALSGGSADDLLNLLEILEAQGIPCASVIDRGHVELPDFDGAPILTAIGVGPVTPLTAKQYLSRLPLWRPPQPKGGAR